MEPGYEKSKLHISKAYGCFIEDCSGNVYIDTALGAGTHILGHANPIIVREIEKQAEKALYIFCQINMPMKLGRFLSQAIRIFSSFVFCNSGTEATIRATRIARASYWQKKNRHV